MPVSIRSLKPADYDAVRRHLKGCWQESYTSLVGNDAVQSMVSSLAAPDLGMLAGDGLALVAIETTGSQSTAIVGTAMAAERRGKGYIWGMYIAPQMQRRGYGRLLLEGCVSRLPQARTFSVTVLDEHPNARAFYEALGFRYQSSCKEPITTGYELAASIMTRENHGEKPAVKNS